MTQSIWGDRETKYFYELTPDRLLTSVENALGKRCTGRTFQLNSMENRVYEIELESEEDEGEGHSPSERARRSKSSKNFVIAKFYRPGRWTKEQILDEHRFLKDLVNAEIPVVAPFELASDSTISELTDAGIWFSIFPKIGGRSPDELEDEALGRVGRLLARIHTCGAARPAEHRLSLDIATFGDGNLQFLLDAKLIPSEIAPAYASVCAELFKTLAPLLHKVPKRRIHGDCHLGNLLDGRDGLFFVDFDDMLMGPPVQDMWLLVGGRDEEAKRKLRLLVEAYEGFLPFDRSSLNLIEGLRALRLIHFSAWIGRRWQDPAFQRAFPTFGSDRYWQEQLRDLREQVSLLRDECERDTSHYLGIDSSYY